MLLIGFELAHCMVPRSVNDLISSHAPDCPKKPQPLTFPREPIYSVLCTLYMNVSGGGQYKQYRQYKQYKQYKQYGPNYDIIKNM